jgi:hypothetical protein
MSEFTTTDFTTASDKKISVKKEHMEQYKKLIESVEVVDENGAKDIEEFDAEESPPKSQSRKREIEEEDDWGVSLFFQTIIPSFFQDLDLTDAEIAAACKRQR